jgi:DNA-binding protein HU-beta
MNKSLLIDEAAAKAGISKASATRAFEAIFWGIERSLKKGQRVTIVGFGTFGVSKRRARTGRNPQTGAPIQIEAKKVVRFKPGKKLDRSINR